MTLRLDYLLKIRGIKVTNVIFYLVISLSISACQNIPFTVNSTDELAANNVDFAQYYLSLKNLSEGELQEEIAQQRLKKSQGSIEAEIKLLLLHSLPNSPIHNVYTAKTKLNEQLKKHKNYYLSSTDQAFFSLLKDQLNQQLFLFQKLINQELAHENQIEANLISNKKQKDKIAALELTVTQLSKKITQLKKIEQSISDHGQ